MKISKGIWTEMISVLEKNSAWKKRLFFVKMKNRFWQKCEIASKEFYSKYL